MKPVKVAITLLILKANPYAKESSFPLNHLARIVDFDTVNDPEPALMISKKEKVTHILVVQLALPNKYSYSLQLCK